MKIQIVGEQSVTGDEGLKRKRSRCIEGSAAARHFHTDIDT